jgi:enoyl-CoA hydratase
MGEYSHVDIKDGWAEIVIDRPERRNSLVPPLFAELTAAFKSLSSDSSIATIILRGAEGYFCSGIDLKAIQDAPPEWQQLPDGNARAMHLALYHCEVPVIMALERFAINAGASLALAGDLIVAGETAFLQIGEIQQGVGIPMNAAWLKIKTTEQVAARLALMGDRVSSAELKTLSLINEVSADDHVVTRCRELAARLAEFPPGASRTIKAALVNQRGIEDPETFFPSQANPGLMSAKLLEK